MESDENRLTTVRIRDEKKEQRREVRFRNVYLGLLAHPEFYETLDRYKPQDDLLNTVRSLLGDDWRIIRNGVWYQCLPTVPNIRFQGWKIHISATLSNCEEILQAAVPIFVQNGVTFKFACDKRMLTLMNSKLWDRGGSGKFVTAYPTNDSQFRNIIDQLYLSLKDFQGPYVLSDKRYKDCKVLHYRFGGINGGTRLTVTGDRVPILVSPEGLEVPDIRTPYFNPPLWTTDPFPDPDDGQEDGAPSLKGGRYTIVKALGFSNTGGVYQGIDNESGKEVVIKEARPYTATDMRGNDAVSLREKEHRILNILKDTGITAQPVDLFWDWEHLFLVETLVDGFSLRRWPAGHSRILRTNPSKQDAEEWFNEYTTVGINLTRALEVLHRKGIVFGDLSPNNIIFNPVNLDIKLVDLEGAYQLGSDKPAVMFTPGFASKSQLSRDRLCFEDDYYALGAVLLFLLFPITSLLDLNPGAMNSFLRSIQADFGLPGEVTSVITSLMQEEDGIRLTPPRTIELLTQAKNKGIVGPVRIQPPTGFSASVITGSLKTITAFIRSTADLQRQDRLFPADIALNNPLGIAHGALGIVRALMKLDGAIPEGFLEWILRQDLTVDRYAPGLYTGLSGIGWALADLGYHEQARTAMEKAQGHYLLYRSADIYSGVSGFGMANLRFWHSTQDSTFLNNAIRVGDWLIKVKAENERGFYWPSTEGTIHVGYARGATGVAMFLLYLYAATNDSRFLEAGKRALEHDLSYGVSTQEGFFSFPEDTVNTAVVLPYWDPGTAGLGTALLRYAMVTKSERFRDLLPKLIPDTVRKYAVFPGLFHGLAGLGNFLLDCREFLGDKHYIEDAYKVASGILLFKIDKPSGTAFPGDNYYRISTDFGTGSAGIGLFFDRLVNGGGNFNMMLDQLLSKYMPSF